MAPSAKPDGRRKSSGSKPTLVVSLAVPSARLREIIQPDAVKEESPATPSKEAKDSPATSATLAVAANGENGSDSNAATPIPEGTPGPSSMGPPDGLKKKGVKRSAPNANGTNDGIPKPRGKPGPKKKPRLEDGTIDHTNAANRAAGAHKLGPKANQGAINAGLRALDRTGKPCRRWAKGGFTLKTFTGVVWEIPRWTAPPKPSESTTDDSGAPSAADNSSGKENKEDGQVANSGNNSNSGDAEMQSAPSVNASSPAPIAISAS